MIQGIIFDVDGTLLNTERIYMRAWKQAGRDAGFDVSDDVLLRTRAIHKADAIRIFQEALGPSFDYDIIQKARIVISEKIIAQTENLLLPGVAETLTWLKAQGYPLAVASSTKRDMTVSHLEHAGLLHYFDAVVGGDMVTRGKPNPDIFLKAARLLGLPPEACMVVEDTPAGIRAAVAAAMCPVLIPDCVKPDETIKAMCHKVLSSMAELPSLL